MAAIQALIDARCFDLYGIHEEDRHTITQGFGAHAAEVGEAEIENDIDAETAAEVDENDDGGGNADAMSLAAGLVSWAVGVAFGRFDMRLATECACSAARTGALRAASGVFAGHAYGR